MNPLFVILFSITSLMLSIPSYALDMSVYDFDVKSIKGEKVDMKSFKGQVLLIVNTASGCGFTPQYKGLQETYAKFKSQGFEVLGFPSNDFGGQEPGTNKEIKNFCELNYKVTFPMFSKVVVSGPNKVPLFYYLTETSGKEFKREIDWNFEKFLINRSGKLVARFKSSVDPLNKELQERIQDLLKEKVK